MKKILNKNSYLILTAVAVLALALGWYLTGDRSSRMKTSGKSPYQTALLEQYAAQTEQERYDSKVADIKISIRNSGETMHELNHPVLEWQREGTWYSLRKGEENAAANLLYIEPGETKQFSLWIESYGKLIAGHYRVVFSVWGSPNYITAEFDIV